MPAVDEAFSREAAKKRWAEEIKPGNRGHRHPRAFAASREPHRVGRRSIDQNVHELYRAQARTVDHAKRKALVHEAQRIILDNMPIAMLQGRVDVDATARYVKDFGYTPYQYFHFSNAFERVWLDK